MLLRAGGEPPNCGSLDAVIEEYGPERVAWHASWYLYRLAASKNPPIKSVPHFYKCVEQDYAVKPIWRNLKFSRLQHGVFTDEQRAQIPTTEDPQDWWAWLDGIPGGCIDDLTPEMRAKVTESAMTGKLRIDDEFDGVSSSEQNSPDDSGDFAADTSGGNIGDGEFVF